MRIKPFLIDCGLLFSVFCLLFITSCSEEKPRQSLKNIAVPVTVAPVTRKTVPVQINAIGNVEAYSTVSIKARVSGELLRVYFSEGQFVNKGDLLFSIDPLPYKTALETAQANLARDTALSKKADNDVVRYSGLFQEQLVSSDDYEKTLANAEALKATLEADRSEVESARLQLDYCSIFAPVHGRTGSLLADQGNLIKADDLPLVVINQIQPVYAAFSVPEQSLPEIKKYMASGKLRVEARASNEDKSTEEGVLTFIDNEVDSATGTIRLKATFANKEKGLWPGQFVNVVLTLTEQPDAVVVPSQAVQTGQQGQFVFVIKDDSAELRPVRTGITYEEITVIEQGLGPQEQVVTDGQIRLMPGAKVQIKNRDQGAVNKTKS
jgi:multidrug efflux system membrane fusion protein